MKNCLLLIDAQNDFLSKDGSFYKKETNLEKVEGFIKRNMTSFDGIVLINDSHYPMDISHASYWVDFEGNKPAIKQQITKKEVKGRKYNAFMPNVPNKVFEEKQKMVVEYLENLESIDRVHTIQPEHCVIGTWGHNVYEPIMKYVLDWSREKGRDYQAVMKGLFQHIEQCGAFEAVVPNPNIQETMLNQGILQYLDNFENVYMWGPKDVVIESLKQLSECAIELQAPDIIDRYKILNSDEETLKYCEQFGFENVITEMNI